MPEIFERNADFFCLCACADASHTLVSVQALSVSFPDLSFSLSNFVQFDQNVAPDSSHRVAWHQASDSARRHERCGRVSSVCVSAGWFLFGAPKQSTYARIRKSFVETLCLHNDERVEKMLPADSCARKCDRHVSFSQAHLFV